MSVSGFNKTTAGAGVNKNRVFKFSSSGVFSVNIDPGFYAISSLSEPLFFDKEAPKDSWYPNDYLRYSSLYGFNVSSTISSLYVSPVVELPSAMTWTDRFSSTLTLNSVAFGAGLFVAVGNSGSVTSSDGVTWTARSASGTKVIRGNSEFVAISSGTFSTGAVVSTDGVTWSGTPVAADRIGITYGNGTYVTVGGSGVIQTSTDGLTWTTRTSGTTSTLNAVTYGNGVFVAGGSAVSRFSTDGITWTNANIGMSTAITAITYGHGIFIAVAAPAGGVSPGARYSTTGNSGWVSVTSGFSSTDNVNQSGYYNGLYYFLTTNVRRGLTAFDSVSSAWDALGSFGGTVAPTSITDGNGIVVAVGSSSSSSPKIATAIQRAPTTALALEYIADQTDL